MPRRRISSRATKVISAEEFDKKGATLDVAQAQVQQALESAYQVRVALGLSRAPGPGRSLADVPPDIDQTFSTVHETLAELFQAAAQIGIIPSRFDLSPKQAVEDTILKLDRIPKTLAVVGAGAIGAEYACTFRALGAEVEIIDGSDVLLPFLDAEVSQALVGALERSGIVFHWDERVQRCLPQPSGGVQLELSSGAVLTVDAVLVAAGRQSNTAKLGLERAGVSWTITPRRSRMLASWP